MHSEEVRGRYASTNIIRVIKSIIMRWAGHVAGMGERRGAYRVSVGTPEGRESLEDLFSDGMIILKWIIQK